MKITTKLWIGILLLAVLSPLGILIPEHFKAGSAWGEWGTEEIKSLTSSIPQGLEKLSSLWNAPMPDYTFKGWSEKGFGHLSLAYLFSAVLGIAIVAGVILLLGKILGKKNEPFNPKKKP